MRRVGLVLGMLLVAAGGVSGCTIDPCTFDQASPSCAVSQSQAQATISAIDADRELRSTQSAIYLEAEATKAAINAEATRQVTGADATHEAMRIEATRQAMRAEATQSAVVYQATQTSVDGEATKIAVQVGGVIDRANTERVAAPYNAAFNVVVFWFLIPSLVVVALIVYGRQVIKHAAEAVAQSAKKRAAIVRYGPENDPQVALVIFDKDGNPSRITTTTGMIGVSANLLTGEDEVARLDVPPELKLRALVEASTRREARGIAAATGKPPWEGTALTQSFYEENQAVLEPARAGYQVNVVSHTLDQMPVWLDEVDRRLLEASHD